MNQILSFEEKGLGSHMGKTVKVFALLMMTFGIVLTAEGGYSLLKNKKEVATGITSIEEAEKIKPEIEFEQNNSKLNIEINAQAEISKITYVWSNDNIEKELLGVSGRKEFSGEIDVPNGTNEINVKVIYKDAKNFPYEKKESFTSNATQIKLSIIPIDDTMKMKIEVEDKTGINNVSYRWNNDAEKIEKPESTTDNNKMEIITEIPYGQNTLYVTAVNMFGEKSEKNQQVKGTAKPEVNATLYADGKLVIMVKAKDNIKNIALKLNGEEYTLNFKEFLEQGYTIEDLKKVPGLDLEINGAEKIIGVNYEYQTTKDSNEIEITAYTDYTSQTVKGTLVKPNE